MSSLGWIVLGSMLAMFAELKLNVPDILADFSWLTVGRVLPAAAASMTYGWAASAGIGAGLWLLARLGRTPLRHGGVLVAAWLLWNLGVTLGTAAHAYRQAGEFGELAEPSAHHLNKRSRCPATRPG